MTVRLEQLKPDALIQGLVGRQVARAVSAELLGEQLLFCGNEVDLELVNWLRKDLLPPRISSNQVILNPPPPIPLRAPLPTRYAVSRKLDPTCASLKMSTFVDAVMIHLLTLPAAPTDMTLEVQVNALVGNDERRTGIALKNTAALKVEKQELY